MFLKQLNFLFRFFNRKVVIGYLIDPNPIKFYYHYNKVQTPDDAYKVQGGKWFKLTAPRARTSCGGVSERAIYIPNADYTEVCDFCKQKKNWIVARKDEHFYPAELVCTTEHCGKYLK